MQPPVNLQDVLARAADTAFVVDEWGTVLFASDEACQMLKYAPGEIDGYQVEHLMPERYRMAHIDQRLRFTDDGRARPMGTDLNLLALCKDGVELPVDISLNPVQRGLRTLMLVAIQLRTVDGRACSANARTGP